MNANEIVRALGERFEEITGAYEVMSALAEMRKEEIETLKSQLADEKRRADAAVEDLSSYKDCGFCAHLQDQQYCYKNCQRHVNVDNFRTHPRWRWRGPQEAGEGSAE